jgi:putative ABC transport system permease protein
MKYLPLLWWGLRRRPLRTTLIVLQVAFALGLFAVLQGVESGGAALVGQIQADLLVVRSLRSGELPLAYLDPIRHVAGVRFVSYQNVFPATYQLPTQHIGALAVDVADAFEAAPVKKVSSALVRTLEATMTGVVATTALADRYGWKPGEHIHVQTTLPLKQGHDIDLMFLGTFTPSDTNGSSEFIVINNRYLDQLRAVGENTVQAFNVRVADPRDDNRVAQRIDAFFQNSPYPTQTDSLRELEQTEMKAIGDMEFEVRAVTAAALFSLLISMGAILAASARERTTEMAVMKAIGFRNVPVVCLLFAESVMVCAIGTAIGFAASSVLFAKAQVMMLGLAMPWTVLVEGLGLACAVACLTTALPAWHVLGMDVSEALAAQ